MADGEVRGNWILPRQTSATGTAPQPPKEGNPVNPAALIIGWAIVLGIFLGILAAMVMAFLAGWNAVGTALAFVALVLVGWAGGELR